MHINLRSWKIAILGHMLLKQVRDDIQKKYWALNNMFGYVIQKQPFKMFFFITSFSRIYFLFILVDSQKLHKLMIELADYCCAQKDCIFQPKIGEPCCARFSGKGMDLENQNVYVCERMDKIKILLNL